jgi:hypothetical protein
VKKFKAEADKHHASADVVSPMLFPAYAKKE